MLESSNVLRIDWGFAGERAGEALQRFVAGPHFPRAPSRRTGRTGLGRQFGQQPGPDQGRLAAPRAAYNRDQPASIEQTIETEDLLLAAEEPLVLESVIGPQSREWSVGSEVGLHDGVDNRLWKRTSS